MDYFETDQDVRDKVALIGRSRGGKTALWAMWFLSEADEVSRVVARKGCPEGSLAQFYDYASLFAAKAFALKESRQELERYLDVPGVWRGDLFYIQNLVATIEAHDKPLANPQALAALAAITPH